MIEGMTVSGGGGGGKGGGSTPVEAPNSLRARSTLRFVHLISEGPIVGFVNGMKSIFLDDTPIQNTDETFNFFGMTIDSRSGLPDQAPFAGFPSVETETSVGVEVKFNIPVVRTVTNLDADAVNVKLLLPALLETKTSTGAVVKTTVQIAIDVAEFGGSFVNRIDDKIFEKTNSAYQRQYRIELVGTGPWQVRMRRITADSAVLTLQNATFFSSFTTIIDHRLIYPDSAVVAGTVNAELFGSRLPTISYEITGLIIQVPTNYNPVTRAYTGIWNGTFKLEWTDNPAWVFYDLITNVRYGLGEFLASRYGLAAPDKWELYEIAQYCDGMVPNGVGGQEPRYTFNGAIATRDEALKVLAGIVSVFRGMMFLSAGAIFVSADRPGDPVKLVVPGNVQDGILTYSGFALKSRHSVALVGWSDPADSYRPAIEVVEDPEAINKYGWRQTEVVAVGCTSRGQAYRTGRWILESERSESELITYTASLDHADVEPGQYISVQDPAYAGIRFGGRIAGIVQNVSNQVVGIVTDAPVTLEAGQTYSLALALPSGAIADRGITNGPGATSTLLFAFVPEVPVAGAIWVLTSSNLAPRTYRVISSREAGKNLFEITAAFHDAAKYARIEQDIILPPLTFSALPSGGIKPPGNLSVIEYAYLAGGTSARSAVTLSWSQVDDPRVSRYEAQFSTDGIDWQAAGATSGGSIDILDFGSGVFFFRVHAVADITGAYSPWAVLNNVTVLGGLAAPPDVGNFQISVIGSTATLTWNPVAALNLSHYEIRFSPDISGALWAAAVPLLYNVTGASIQTPAMVGTYLIKAVTQQGIPSPNAALIVSLSAGFANMNTVSLLAENPSFAGAMSGVIRHPTIAAIMLDYAGDVFIRADWFGVGDWFLGTEGTLASGVYNFAQSIDLTSVYTSRISAQIAAYGEAVTADVFAAADWFEVIDFFNLDPSLWDVTIESRATNDNPAGSPVWTAWAPVVIGDVTARAFQFRVILRSYGFNVQTIVTQLSANISMLDRALSGVNLSVPSGGLRVNFVGEYYALTGVAISASSMATGDYYEITNKGRIGFDIRFFNSVGTPIARVFDYVAQGYGKKEI